jgi:hypothetical protein
VDLKIVLGDGRLTLEEARQHSYDLIVLDAFNSDAIPVHLLTKEALDLYLSKLSSDGVIAVHITNRVMNLAPLVGNLAAAKGLPCYLNEDWDINAKDRSYGKYSSTWVVIARRKQDVAALLTNRKWLKIEADPTFRTWTDDYSDILEVILRQH